MAKRCDTTKSYKAICICKECVDGRDASEQMLYHTLARRHDDDEFHNAICKAIHIQDGALYSTEKALAAQQALQALAEDEAVMKKHVQARRKSLDAITMNGSVKNRSASFQGFINENKP